MATPLDEYAKVLQHAIPLKITEIDPLLPCEHLDENYNVSDGLADTDQLLKRLTLRVFLESK
ncbi:hypothetical protein BJL95_19805 [Methylomonas sp. LWB]|nr:hypothetical protein BJL95_19805 [Methylomonas sp. LWB]